MRWAARMPGRLQVFREQPADPAQGVRVVVARVMRWPVVPLGVAVVEDRKAAELSFRRPGVDCRRGGDAGDVRAVREQALFWIKRMSPGDGVSKRLQVSESARYPMCRSLCQLRADRQSDDDSSVNKRVHSDIRAGRCGDMRFCAAAASFLQAGVIGVFAFRLRMLHEFFIVQPKRCFLYKQCNCQVSDMPRNGRSERRHTHRKPQYFIVASADMTRCARHKGAPDPPPFLSTRSHYQKPVFLTYMPRKLI